ncbi:hypothetical protein [uncultured Amnibacterium sp.]|uniref:hypothetical protein n=1 Tax=uncultured Amnibacterium sp. TaxID=1631851 RepID=UPI0035CC3182
MLPTEGRTDDDVALERLRRAVYAPTGGAASLAAYRRALAVRSAARHFEQPSLPPSDDLTPPVTAEPETPFAVPTPAPAPVSVSVSVSVSDQPASAQPASRRRVAVIALGVLVLVVVATGIAAMLAHTPADPAARPTLVPNDFVLSDRAEDVAAAHQFVRNSVRAPVGSEPVDFFAQRGLPRPGTGQQVLQIAATERHLSASGRVGLGLLAPVTTSHGSVLVLCDRPATFSWRIDTGATSSAVPTKGPAASPVIRSSGRCGGDLIAATFDVPGGTLLTTLTLTLPRGTHAVLEVAVTD